MRSPSTHAISELEFESLPPALRRKYFSSLERLRLAKDGCAPSLPSPSAHRQPVRRPRHTSFFDPPELGARSSNTKSRLQKRKSSARLTPVNPDTAAWFASLPPAVRRKQFSKEEQILFASERHSIILDATDELLGRRCRPKSPLAYSSCESRPQTSYLPQHDDQRSFFFESDDSEDEANDQEDTKLETKGDMADFSLDSLRWLEEEPQLDLRLDDYHNVIAETAQRQSATPTRQPFRRNLSLSTMSLRRSSISSQHNNLSTRSSMFFKPPLSPAQIPSPQQPKPLTTPIDPRATFYQDPAARMKLRVYLASASKFDEAVEFGFPSLETKPSASDARPKTSPRTTNDSGRTFYSDDTPSLSHDDEDSHDELDIVHDPRTPEDSEFKLSRRSHKISNDRQSIRPQTMRGITEPYAHSTTFDREMTIRMTLTRPDLRSPEGQNAKTSVNTRPIEQPELPPCDNSVSIWDTLPLEESKMKRIWKKLKLR